MLKIDIHDEEQGGRRARTVLVECQGNLVEVTADISRAILAIYSQLKKRSPVDAASFRFVLASSMQESQFWTFTREFEHGESTSIFIKK